MAVQIPSVLGGGGGANTLNISRGNCNITINKN